MLTVLQEVCARMASGVTRVIERCENAKESENLDLSECQLMQMPDAVFHLMRHTNLKSCDLSFNVITKIPPKLATNFSCITELNVSNNRIGKLPDELGELQELMKLDISHNAFVSLPRIVYTLPKLENINAEKNYIADVDTRRLEENCSLKLANLRQNPLTKDCHEALSTVTSITILFCPRIEDEWEKSEKECEEVK